MKTDQKMTTTQSFTMRKVKKKTYDSENNELLFIVYVDDVLRTR